VDGRAREVGPDRLRHARALERDRDPRPRRAEQRVRHLRRRPAARHLRVDLDDAVALLHAGALGRRVGEHAGDGDELALLEDLHADAGVAPVGLARELGDLLRREELGVRVVELLDEPARRPLVERARAHGVDEALSDELHRLLEQLRRAGAARGARLEHPAAGDERRGGEGRQAGGADGGTAGRTTHCALGLGGGQQRRQYRVRR
jgi:hypothetical protein